MEEPGEITGELPRLYRIGRIGGMPAVLCMHDSAGNKRGSETAISEQFWGFMKNARYSP